jgi:hypothetical protein
MSFYFLSFRGTENHTTGLVAAAIGIIGCISLILSTTGLPWLVLDISWVGVMLLASIPVQFDHYTSKYKSRPQRTINSIILFFVGIGGLSLGLGLYEGGFWDIGYFIIGLSFFLFAYVYTWVYLRTYKRNVFGVLAAIMFFVVGFLIFLVGLSLPMSSETSHDFVFISFSYLLFPSFFGLLS